MARATPSMSALTKFSVTGSARASLRTVVLRAREVCASASGAGRSVALSTAAATAAGSVRPRRGCGGLRFMLIRSI